MTVSDYIRWTQGSSSTVSTTGWKYNWKRNEYIRDCFRKAAEGQFEYVQTPDAPHKKRPQPIHVDDLI